MMILLEDESKGMLSPIILFGEVFGWVLKVEWKCGRDEVLSWKNLELISNLDRSKWEKHDEVEKTLLINEEKVLKLF